MDSSSEFHSTDNTSTPMGEAVSSSTTTSLSLEISRRPRDFLQLAMINQTSSSSSSSSSSSTTIRLGESLIGGEEGDGDDDGDDEGLNLGLGLSLGGKFGVDKSQRGLKRSSSIIGTMPLIREDVTVAQSPPSLVRTASLPFETGEEWRKRKEMQTLRRMEAKRRRFEKQRVLKEGGSGGGGEEKGFEGVNFRGRLEKEQQNLGIISKFSGSSSSPSPSSSSRVEMKGGRTTFGSLQGFLMAQDKQGGSQFSGEAQGASCSRPSELGSRTHQGLSSCGDARSPGSTHSAQEQGGHEAMGSSSTILESSQRPPTVEADSPSKLPEQKRREAGGGGGGGVMEDMPCVFTIGDGPKGRKVEGILYRYGKGEEVRIMCVCHGSFFSPAEFVKHAGGKDVDHPLRHIVVSPSPWALW